jgi:serine/threonine protein kinase
LKILKEEKASSHVVELTIQEATLLNKMNHENIIKVKHLIKLDNKYYMGMELLAG